MFKFQKTKGMLPSEMLAYVKTLETEIKRLEEHNQELIKPNLFASGADKYETEADLLAGMKVGEVIEARNLREFGSSFKVKITEHRIDEYPTRMEAEHVAMLHSV